MTPEPPDRAALRASAGIEPHSAAETSIAIFAEKNSESARHLLAFMVGSADTGDTIVALSKELWRWVKHRPWQVPDRADQAEVFLTRIARQVVVVHLGPEDPTSLHLVSQTTPDDELAELVLALRAKAGDQRSFAAIWQKHYVVLLGFVRITCSRALRFSPAEEYLNWLYELLVQDVRNFDPGRSGFLPFVRDRAKRSQNKFIQRSFGRELQLSGRAAHDRTTGEEDSPDSAADPLDRTLDAVVSRDLLRKALRVLFELPSPPHQVLVFALRRVIGWNNAEIIASCWHWRLQAVAGLLGSTRYELRTGDFGIDEVMGGLRKRLAEPLGSVITHGKTRQSYRPLLDSETAENPYGSFRFLDFGRCHEDSPASVIDNWIENADKQFRKNFRIAYGNMAANGQTQAEEAAR